MAYRINPFTGNLDLVSFETVLAPLVIDTNQILTLPQSDAATDGYLSAADWNLFNGKQNLLTAGANITITTVGPITTISSTGGGGSSYTPVPNGGIDIDASVIPNTIATIYDTAIGNSVMSIPVGGAGSLPASTWKTKTIVQALDAILFPQALPTYTVTSISLTGSASTLVEVGAVVSQTLNLYAYKNDAGNPANPGYTKLEIYRGISLISSTTNPVASPFTNIPGQFGYANPNSPNKQYLKTFTDIGIPILSGTTSWSGKGDYNAGLPKQDNFGAFDTRTPAVRNPNAPQAAEVGFTSNSVSVTGIYPYYVYKSTSPISPTDMVNALASGAATGYLAYSTGTIVIPAPTANGQYVAVAYPATSTTKTIWYVNALNTGTIPGGVFGAATVASCNSLNYPAVSPLGGIWNNILYKIHVTTGSGGAITEASQMELRN
jgi:hypothetical protein